MIIESELYRKIIRLMPIACVDLLVSDNTGRILMVKRKNSPAMGQWWFPGGRIFFGEPRSSAAERILEQECGLRPLSLKERGTFDLIFAETSLEPASHAITTIFHVVVGTDKVSLDDQSSAHAWDFAANWIDRVGPAFLVNALVQYQKGHG